MLWEKVILCALRFGASWDNHSYRVDQRCAVYVKLLLQVCRHEASHLLSINKHSVHWIWSFDVYAQKWSTRSALSAQQLPGKARLAACFPWLAAPSAVWWAWCASPVLNVQRLCRAAAVPCVCSAQWAHAHRGGIPGAATAARTALWPTLSSGSLG